MNKKKRKTKDESTNLFESESDEMLLIEAASQCDDIDVVDSEPSTTASNPTSNTINKKELKNIAVSCLNKQFSVAHMENCTFNFNIHMANQ